MKNPDDGKCQVDTVEQPPNEEWIMPDGIFYKRLLCKSADMLVPQHAHKYGHTSLIVTGAFHVWADGVSLGRCDAPRLLWIAPGVKHMFRSLEPNSSLFCVHDLEGGTEVAVLEEHQIGDFQCLGA